MKDLIIFPTAREIKFESMILKDLERDFNSSHLMKDPTRITNVSSSTIDLIVTDMDHIADSGVIDAAIMDHLPIYVIRKKARTPQKYKTGRSYIKYDEEIFIDL